MLRHKDANGGIKDVDKKKSIVVGYASHFGNIDSHGDIVDPGSFKRTINNNAGRVKVLAHHDPHQLLGKPTSMSEDEKGLLTESFISKTSYGQDMLTLIEDEVLDEMSIGYIPVKEEFDEERRANIISEVKLVEYSFVTLASNPQARIQGMKAEDQYDFIIKSMLRMEKSLRDSEFVSDEVPERIEFALKYWALLLENAKAKVGAVQETNSVTSDSDSSSEDTRPPSDPADATRGALVKAIQDWQIEQDILSEIKRLGESLGG